VSVQRLLTWLFTPTQGLCHQKANRGRQAPPHWPVKICSKQSGRCADSGKRLGYPDSVNSACSISERKVAG